MYKSDIFHLFFIFSRFGRPILTGIDGLGCSFEERCVQGNGKGVSRNLWKINSYEGKIEIIRRSRKENARYLDLLCSDTIWKRGREKVEPRPLADTLVLFTKFSSRFLFSFFFPLANERIGEKWKPFRIFLFSLFLFASSSLLPGYLYASARDPDGAPSYFNGRNND